MPLGIGVITYNRASTLIKTVGAVMFFTKSPYYLVVADDGSRDDTIDHCSGSNITIITGKNHGVAWNKNRALYPLVNAGADPIILLEDDCYPVHDGWDLDWISAAKQYHHVNYIQKHVKERCSGSGTPADPWRSKEYTGLATISTLAALKTVGYLNTKFKGYGYGHLDWTGRFCKAKYIDCASIPCMICGLAMAETKTYRNAADVQRNSVIFRKLARYRRLYIDPWRNRSERIEFTNEVAVGLSHIPLKVRDLQQDTTRDNSILDNTVLADVRPLHG